MKNELIKSGLTAVSAIGFLLLGSCSSQKPNEVIFNSRGGHMPNPGLNGANAVISKPAVDNTNPLLLNDNNSTPATGIIIEDSVAPVNDIPLNTNPVTPVSNVTYKVRKNESLWSISRAHGITRHDLARENNINPDTKLKLGQTLTLPPGARYMPPSERPKIKNTSPAAGGSQKYKVKKGDSLSVIAYRYKTSVKALKSANNLKSNTIRVNQTLTIPNKNSPRSGSGNSGGKSFSSPSVKASGNLYTVKKGDTLSEIAHKNGSTTKAIMQANGLKNHKIYVGKKLVIPGYKGSKSTKTDKPSNLQEEIKNDLFGDKKDDPKVKDPVVEDDIDNPFTDNTGDKKPAEDDQPAPVNKKLKTMDILVVEADTLESLAKDFMTTVELLKEANPEVKGNENLKPGMVLKVPTK